MTTYLDLTNKALDLWHQVHGDESLDQQCQRESGYYTSWAYLGTEAGIVGYSTAKAAALASPIGGHDINSAPVGSYVYWQIGTAWHVGVIVGYDGGRALVAYATTKGDTVLALRYGVKVSHADSYPAPFYGWSVQNGANRPISGLDPWPTPTPKPTPTQRVAVPAGANRRSDPSTANSATGGIKGGQLGTMVGWLHGETVSGNNVWFKDDAGFYWSGGFTDTGTHDLPDLTPAPPVTPPTDPEPPVTDPPTPVDPEPEGPGEADPSEPDTPAEPTPDTPDKPPAPPAKPAPVGGIVALVVAVVGLIAGVLTAIFGS